MARNYKHEHEQRKNKETRLYASISKEQARKFKERLKMNNVKYQNWLKIQIEKYVNNI